MTTALTEMRGLWGACKAYAHDVRRALVVGSMPSNDGPKRTRRIVGGCKQRERLRWDNGATTTLEVYHARA